VIEALLFDDEATVLADGFFDVRGDVPVALGALVRARLRLDVFVEISFVGVSDCHRSHCVQELASTANPSPIKGIIDFAGILKPIQIPSRRLVPGFMNKLL
jgi:hypothetical protein